MSNDDLTFVVMPDGGIPYQVDLSEFAHGRSGVSALANLKGTWSGDFQGRPGFAADLRKWFDSDRPKEYNATAARGAMRSLLRFLDRYDEHRVVKDVGDLSDHHGFLLFRDPDFASPYYRVRWLVTLLRLERRLPVVLWPAPPREGLKQLDDLEMQAVWKVYRALKKEAHGIMAMFREGEDLARKGVDPRQLPLGEKKAGWRDQSNQAFVVKKISEAGLPQGRSELRALGCNELIERTVHGPSYVVPGMMKGTAGVTGALRWFHPSKAETIVFLWLFLIGTGWNLATALSLDISTTEKWMEVHPQKSDMRIIHAFKDRADRHQFTLSMEEPQFHPYQLVTFMIERTAGLRATLVNEKETLLESGRAGNFKAQRRIAIIDQAIKSPWLFHSIGRTGGVDALVDGNLEINGVIRNIVAAHGIEQSNQQIVDITTKDARRAWIGHAYYTSGYHLLLTRLASQHSNLKTLRYYLRSHQLRAASEKKVRSLQNAILEEIAGGRIVDPTRLRLLVEVGQITPEVERRLLDFRQRTRLGMGCLSPTTPPRAIAPNHVEGALCKIQRCTGCEHGVVFEDSLDLLARCHAELVEIKKTIPLNAWVGSSFDDEEVSISETLKCFDARAVEEATKGWTSLIQGGQVKVHDVYPNY